MSAILDKNLSIKAKGVYSIISYFIQNGSDINAEIVLDNCSDGKDSVRNAIKELEKTGYITKSHIRNNDGLFIGWKYTLLK